MSSLPEEPANQTSTSWSWGTLERISKISAQVTVVVGVLAALYGLRDSLERSRLAERAGKLQSLGYIQAFIKEDFGIQTRISQFNYDDQLPELEAKAAAANEPGRNLYFSTDGLGDVATIGEHYEDIGAELKLGYLDFNLVYEIIPFPDDFWERTRTLRKSLRDNWEGKGKPLPDLWSNFGYLCDLYRTQRRRDDPKALEGIRNDVALCKE
jgi:hypothetical protein